MEVTELTKTIYDNYPKTWKKLKEYLFDINYNLMTFQFYNDYQIVLISFDPLGQECFICHVPFNLLYGLLEEFFYAKGIILHELLQDEYSQFSFMTLSAYQNLQQTIILKACKILEEELNEKIR